MENLHNLNTVQAIGRDFRKVDKNWEDTRRALGRGEHSGQGAKAMEEDTVNWKTSNTHYHAPPAAPAEPKSGGVMSKVLGPALIASGILGTGGLGAAGYVAGKLIDHYAEEAPVAAPVEVRDSEVDVRFVGGQKE